MPLALDRLPIPTLTTYSVLSTALFVSLVYHAKQVTKDPSWKNSISLNDRNTSDILVDDEDHLIDLNSFNFPDEVDDVLLYMIQDSFSRWAFINTVGCAVILFGKAIQRLVFGSLRSVEVLNFREKLCNYFLYKFIFMFGVIKVQTPEDVMLLLGWFGLLGFLQIFVQFSKDRLEYMVTVSSHVTVWNRCKIVTLLLCLFSVASYMIYLCLTHGVHLGYNIFAFMTAECLSVTLRVPHILIKYVIDPFEAKFIRSQNQRYRSQNSFANSIICKMEMSLYYYVSLFLELADLSLELLHYLHMLLWGNIIFSVPSLAIFMHVRFLTTEIRRKFKKHRNYMWILNHMEKEYPIASLEELNKNSDNCAICWEKMEVARKLPCGHLFHSTCLQLWLEQDTSCPTCRYILNVNGTNVRRSPGPRQTRSMMRIGATTTNGINHQHFFHFDGSRYVSWLPSFSVQVLSTVGGAEVDDPQVESMARQIQQIFPHYPTNVLIENLRQTRSVNSTVDNILEGLIPIETEHANFAEETPHISRMDSEEQSQSTSSDSINNNTNVVATDNATSSNSFRGNASVELSAETEIEECNNEFSNNPTERELALRNRKEKLFQKAKKMYLEKKAG